MPRTYRTTDASPARTTDASPARTTDDSRARTRARISPAPRMVRG
ncbi:hypothetical protein [Microbacterium lacticum]